MRHQIIRLTTDHPDYPRLTGMLAAPDIAGPWRDDADSWHEDGVEYVMALVDGVPAAWSGWRYEEVVTEGVVDGVPVVDRSVWLRCMNNYVRRGFRVENLGVDLWSATYRIRHDGVVVQRGGHRAFTYVYDGAGQPWPVHASDGWTEADRDRCVTPGGFRMTWVRGELPAL
jgi:hypothetical protein